MRHLTLIALFTILFPNLARPAGAVASGGVTSSGGDSTAAEFVITARHIAEIIKSEVPLGFTSEEFLKAVDATQVVSEDRIYLNGFERDAVNYPKEKRIVVGRHRWWETANQTGRRYTLVMHEYLSIMGIDDSAYQISSQLFQANGRKRYEIICFSILGDLEPHFSRDWNLHFISYQNKEVSLIKSKAGEMMKPPFGAVLMGATGDSLGNVFFLFTFQMGFVRNIQIPAHFPTIPSGPLVGLTWDTAPAGKAAVTREISCEAQAW